MKRLLVCTCLLLLCAEGVLTRQQPAAAGTQTMIARYTPRPVTIDGVLGPAEWSAAIPVHVAANKPGGPPGVVPGFITPPDNQDDSSFTIRAMYDDQYLYVAVDVADNILISDSPGVPWEDDDVEVLIDGDRQPGDITSAVFDGQPPNNEGFQLLTSVGDARFAAPYDFGVGQPPVPVVWESRAGRSPRGFVVELRVALSSINTHDTSPWTGGTPGYRQLRRGDAIGFNVTVGDDDSGGASYDRTDLNPNPNSYIAWDGSSTNWFVWDEPAWGTLYLAP